MTETTYPGESNTFQEQWPYVSRDDGILGDLDGTAYAITPSGSSATVTIAAGNAACAGFGHVNDADAVLDLTAVGTEPTSGQKRVDRICVVYDWSRAGTDLDTACQLEVIPGTPTSTSTSDLSARPSIPRTSGTRWAVPLWWVSRPYGGVVTAYGSERVWSGAAVLAGADFDSTVSYPLGTRLTDSSMKELVRALHPTYGDARWLSLAERGGYVIKAQPAPDRDYDQFSANTWSNVMTYSATHESGTYRIMVEVKGSMTSSGTYQVRINDGTAEGYTTFDGDTITRAYHRMFHISHGGGTLLVRAQCRTNHTGRVHAGSSISVNKIV